MTDQNPTPRRRQRDGIISNEVTPTFDANEATQQPIQEPALEAKKLDAILARLSQLEEENTALKATVGQTEFERNLAQQTKDKRPTIKLMFIYDKRNNRRVITSWSNMIQDVVYVDGGRVHENQIVNVTFLDGKTEEMPYDMAFNHQNRTEPLPVESVTTRNGKRYYTVEVEGQMVEIEETFIN